MKGHNVYFDVETTGLNPFVHEPFEFGLVVEDQRGQVINEDAFYFHPRLGSASSEAMAVNRYEERVKAGEMPRRVTRLEARALLETWLVDATMVVNSLQFDLMMAATFLYGAGSENPTPWSHRSIDLKSVTSGVLGIDLKLVTTGAVKRHFNLPWSGEHTALGDAWFNHDWYHALELWRG